jgi:hypothetical protein
MTAQVEVSGCVLSPPTAGRAIILIGEKNFPGPDVW